MNTNDSTDEDARRFDASRTAGFVESEFERGGVTSGVESELITPEIVAPVLGCSSNANKQPGQSEGEPIGGGVTVDQSKQVDNSVEQSGDGKVSQNVGNESKEVSSGLVEKDVSDDDSESDSVDKSAPGFGHKDDDSDDESIHSSDSDARHDLDYMANQKGNFI